MTYILKDDDNPFLTSSNSTADNRKKNTPDETAHADNANNAVHMPTHTVPRLRVPVRISAPVSIKRTKPISNHLNTPISASDASIIKQKSTAHTVVNDDANNSSNHGMKTKYVGNTQDNGSNTTDNAPHNMNTLNADTAHTGSIMNKPAHSEPVNHDAIRSNETTRVNDSSASSDYNNANTHETMNPAVQHDDVRITDESAPVISSVNAHQPGNDASSDVLIYDDSGTVKNQVKHKAGRVILIIMLIVFIIGCMFTSFKIGGFTRDKYYHDNPVIQKVTDTIINPTPMDRETMKSLVKTLQALDGSKTDNVHIAAIAGVIYGESKGDSTALERTDGSKPDNCEVNDSTGSSKNCSNDAIMKWVQSGAHGIGILQWTGDRAVKYLNYADNNGSKWDDLNTQVSYLLIELDDVNQWREPLDDNGNVGINGQAGLDRFNNATDVSTASKSLLLGFVRPAKPNDSYWMRLRAALDAYSWIQINEAGVSWDDAYKKEHLW